ncbi:MAG: hypothetical protein ACO3GX_17550, partial [Gemmataceae bacterium]
LTRQFILAEILSELTESWPQLPANIKAAIMAVIIDPRKLVSAAKFNNAQTLTKLAFLRSRFKGQDQNFLWIGHGKIRGIICFFSEVLR